MSRSGADLALLLLGGFQSLADAATDELAHRGFDGVRPAHKFAMRAIIAGAVNASELGRQLSISKQAAAKTIATLEHRGYVAREAAVGSRRRYLQVTSLGYELLRQGEAIFNDLRRKWEQQVGFNKVREFEELLKILVGSQPARRNTPMRASQDLSDPD